MIYKTTEASKYLGVSINTIKTLANRAEFKKEVKMRDNGFKSACPSGNHMLSDININPNLVHLTSCSGDSYTEEEIDRIMARIKESKNDNPVR